MRFSVEQDKDGSQRLCLRMRRSEECGWLLYYLFIGFLPVWSAAISLLVDYTIDAALFTAVLTLPVAVIAIHGAIRSAVVELGFESSTISEKTLLTRKTRIHALADLEHIERIRPIGRNKTDYRLSYGNGTFTYLRLLTEAEEEFFTLLESARNRQE